MRLYCYQQHVSAGRSVRVLMCNHQHYVEKVLHSMRVIHFNWTSQLHNFFVLTRNSCLISCVETQTFILCFRDTQFCNLHENVAWTPSEQDFHGSFNCPRSRCWVSFHFVNDALSQLMMEIESHQIGSDHVAELSARLSNPSESIDSKIFIARRFFTPRARFHRLLVLPIHPAFDGRVEIEKSPILFVAFTPLFSFV